MLVKLEAAKTEEEAKRSVLYKHCILLVKGLLCSGSLAKGF